MIVEDGAHGPPSVTRRFGSKRMPGMDLAPGVKPPGESFGNDPVWVVNLSTRTVRVQFVQYGRSLGFGSSPTVIPPNTAAHFVQIDHIGPRDVPPAQVPDEVELGMAFREWLTWDE